jgi:uncharacterized peroxidase-related enzyme
MPRIKPIDPSRTSGVVAEQLAGTKKMFGGTPNMFITAGHSPAALTALNGFFGALAGGRIRAPIAERIAIAVAQANGCEYCLSAHTAVGKMHAVPVAELAAARRGKSADASTQAILDLALAIVAARGRIRDADLAAARAAGLNDGDIVEVVAHVALNVFTNYLNIVAGTEVDFPVVQVQEAA